MDLSDQPTLLKAAWFKGTESNLSLQTHLPGTNPQEVEISTHNTNIYQKRSMETAEQPQSSQHPSAQPSLPL